jgi:hypothetical protein
MQPNQGAVPGLGDTLLSALDAAMLDESPP